MIALFLPSIAGMLIMMGVLARLRRRYRDSRVDLWLLGTTFILIEALAYAVIRGGSHVLARPMHVIALDAYLLAAVTFGWAAQRDLLPGKSHLPLFLLSAVPLFGIATIYGMDVIAPPLYVGVAVASVFGGFFYALTFAASGRRYRATLLSIHLVIWLPMIWMAIDGQLRLLVYWGLACLYMLVAVSFRSRVRRDGVGGMVTVAGFSFWALCFLAHPFVRNAPTYNTLVEQVWDMQKFFVLIGMVLLLLEDQTRLREAEAMRDPLTGLPNRRLFDDRLSQAIARAQRTGLHSAVFVLDFDQFKLVNDTYGHRTGDLMLECAARVLSTRVRSSDTLARCGGDEFAVVVNDLARREDCDRIARTLRDACVDCSLPVESTIELTCSVGYAVFPEDAVTAKALYQLADERMYAEKRASRERGLLRGAADYAASATIESEVIPS